MSFRLHMLRTMGNDINDDGDNNNDNRYNDNDDHDGDDNDNKNDDDNNDGYTTKTTMKMVIMKLTTIIERTQE